MVWRTVWQRLTRLRKPPRSQSSAPAAGPAAAPIPVPHGKQRRGYSDKAIHHDDYEDKDDTILPQADGTGYVRRDGQWYRYGERRKPPSGPLECRS